MKLSEFIRHAAAREAGNPAQSALKHMNKALDQIGDAIKIIHDMREPEMKKVQDQINKVVGDLYKTMIPISERARRPA